MLSELLSETQFGCRVPIKVDRAVMRCTEAYRGDNTSTIGVLLNVRRGRSRSSFDFDFMAVLLQDSNGASNRSSRGSWSIALMVSDGLILDYVRLGLELPTPCLSSGSPLHVAFALSIHLPEYLLPCLLTLRAMRKRAIQPAISEVTQGFGTALGICLLFNT